jgi:hypothetical protein
MVILMVVVMLLLLALASGVIETNTCHLTGRSGVSTVGHHTVMVLAQVLI